MKFIAAAAAGATLVALAFLHPAPGPALLASGPRQAHSRAPLGRGSTGALSRAAHHDTGEAPLASGGAALLVVYVAGEVQSPGLYRVLPGARADDALRKAGGFTQHADRAGVNLAEVVQDGEEVRVPRMGDPAPKKRAARKSLTRAPIASVDLNAAGAAELAQLPGVGETLAERIVAYREQNGPFASVDELADVSGMTQRRVDALAQYLSVR